MLSETKPLSAGQNDQNFDQNWPKIWKKQKYWNIFGICKKKYNSEPRKFLSNCTEYVWPEFLAESFLPLFYKNCSQRNIFT